MKHWKRRFGGSVVDVRVVSGRIFFESDEQPRREVPYLLDMVTNTLRVADDGEHLAERVGDGMAACERAYCKARRQRAHWLAHWRGKAKLVGAKVVPLLPVPMVKMAQ